MKTSMSTNASVAVPMSTITNNEPATIIFARHEGHVHPCDARTNNLCSIYKPNATRKKRLNPSSVKRINIVNIQ
jgi:hypothetical protein